MSLLLNKLSRFAITFLPRRKWLLFYFILFYFFMTFNFMAAITIHSDFGVQENKVSHCFHCFPIYLPWIDGNGVKVVPPDVNKCLIWKDPDTGKDWGGRRRGQQRMRCLDGITESVDMSLSKLRGWWMNRGAHCSSVHVVAKRRTWLRDWTELMGPDAMIFVFWMLSFKPVFSLFSFTFIKRLLPLHFLP